MAVDYYKVLQVDPRADHDVVKAAYHALAKLFKNDSKKLRELNDADEIIGDEDKRVKYDGDRKPKGKIIGDYKLLEKIAEGGFGVTYKAIDTSTDGLVCVKHASHIGPEDEALLREEAKAMWGLRHFGVPSIKHVLKMPDGSLSLVMDYVPGKTLAQIIEDVVRLDPEHVAWICERLLNILKYLHLHGIVHGDVKPQNVIIQNETHTVVLVDYGLAAVKPSKKSVAKGYTEYFAAPEQMDGRPIIPETDLYGLGMTMIYALGGDVINVRVPDHTPDNLCKFIKSLIRREPLSRPKVWKVDLCEEIARIRLKDFGRVSSGMKPLPIK